MNGRYDHRSYEAIKAIAILTRKRIGLVTRSFEIGVLTLYSDHSGGLTVENRTPNTPPPPLNHSEISQRMLSIVLSVSMNIFLL